MFLRDYEPGFNAERAIRLLLKHVPSKYLVGLRSIVVMNTSAFPQNQRRLKTWSRGKKTKLVEALGSYQGAWQKSPASIELYIDNILKQASKPFCRLPFVRNFLLAETLYHEIGHHIHKTHRPEHREREDIADEWQRKLIRNFVADRYWFLFPVAAVAALTVGLIGDAKRLRKRMLRWWSATRRSRA